MQNTYPFIRDFLRKYPSTIAWRVKSHCKVIDRHLNPEEKVLYAFCGQKNDEFYDVMNTCVVAITNKRIMVGIKRVLFGYFFLSITPDMFNDFNVYAGLFFGKVTIDTIKEKLVVSNLSKRSLTEIETNVTEYVMEAKKEYANTAKKTS